MFTKIGKRLSTDRKGGQNVVLSVVFATLTKINTFFAYGAVFMFFQELVKVMTSSVHIFNPVYSIVSASIYLSLGYILEYINYHFNFVSVYNNSKITRINLADKIRKIPMSAFESNETNPLIQNSMNDVQLLETGCSHFIPTLYSSLIIIVFSVVSLIVYDWRLGLLGFTGTILGIFGSYLISNITKKSIAKVLKHNREFKLATLDALAGLKELKSYNYADKHDQIINDYSKMDFKLKFKTEIIVGVLTSLLKILVRVSFPILMLVGIRYVNNPNSLYIFIIYIVISINIFALSDSVGDLQVAMKLLKVGINNIFKINSIENSTGNSDIDFKTYNIEFKDVSFAYDNKNEVLKNINIKFEQNKTTALIGHSGCGKSTISKLAFRFYEIKKGKITLDGYDISKIDPEYLMKYFSIVFQDVILFNETILENIRKGNNAATDEEVLRAAKLANCDSFALKLEDGYNSYVGENGAYLSGGEKQRISIARAILKDAPIIVFDESTTNLDPENENDVQIAITNLIKNKTVIVIAHKLSSIRDADKVILIEKGKVIKEGTPKEIFTN